MSRRRFDRRDLLAVAVGGVLGASLRWGITETSNPADGGGWFVYAPNTSAALEGPGLAWRTIAVNVLGCLLLGAVLALRKREGSPRRLLLAAGTGFCGSLTTFSTFAVDVTSSLRGPLRPRSNEAVNVLVRDTTSPGQALVYLALSVLAGTGAFLLGRVAVTRLIARDPT